MVQQQQHPGSPGRRPDGCTRGQNETFQSTKDWYLVNWQLKVPRREGFVKKTQITSSAWLHMAWGNLWPTGYGRWENHIGRERRNQPVTSTVSLYMPGYLSPGSSRLTSLCCSPYSVILCSASWCLGLSPHVSINPINTQSIVILNVGRVGGKGHSGTEGLCCTGRLHVKQIETCRQVY